MEPAEGAAAKPPLVYICQSKETDVTERKKMATQIELYRRIREAMADDAEVVAMCDKHIKPYEDRASRSAGRTEWVREGIKRLSSRGVTRFSARMVKEECGGAYDGKALSIQGVSRSLGKLVEAGYITKDDVLEKGEPTMYVVL